MTERDNQLARASAENGSFDPAKAKKLTTDAVSRFHRRLKWAARLTWVYLIAGVVVMIVSCNSLLAATSTKAIIGFGVLLLVAYETTILVKLWYWIVNTKVTLLRELKEWKLQMALSSSGARVPAENETSPRTLGLSRFERILWFVVLMFACMAAADSRLYGDKTPVTPMTVGECVMLNADGSATSLMKISEPLWLVTGSFDFWYGEPEKVRSISFLDDRGRPLPFDVSTERSERHYKVRLIEPIMPGEKLQYTQTTELSPGATKKGDLWSYVGDLQYGGAENRYSITVELPHRAQIVAVDPQPAAKWTDNGVERLAFQATRKQDEHFRFKIEYRFTDKAGGDKRAARSAPSPHQNSRRDPW